MNKQAHTYQTPAGAVTGASEVPGALWYGTVRGSAAGDIHEIAVIREEGDEVLCAGPTFLGWRKREQVARDASDPPP